MHYFIASSLGSGQWEPGDVQNFVGLDYSSNMD